MLLRRFTVRLISVLLVPLAVWTAATAADPNARKALPTDSSMAAILIGVSDYNRFSNLRWCDNDVDLVARTLRTACQCDRIVVMTNRSREKLKPNRGNILAELRGQLRRAERDGYRRVLIYFAGHGVRDGDGALYLAPQDFSYEQISETGIRVAQLRRELDQHSNITSKILILDTCHAGETRSGIPSLGGAVLAGGFRRARSLFTLASCGADEQSFEWSERRHGLFTYWLCMGLEGSADQPPFGNDDRRVDCDELERFVAKHVAETAQYQRQSQHPVAIRSEDWTGPIELSQFVDRDPGSAQRGRIDRLIAESLKYAHGGNLTDAIEQLDAAFQIAPGDPELFAWRGRFLLYRSRDGGNTHDLEAAIAQFNQALRGGTLRLHDRQLGVVHSFRSDALFSLKRFSEALEDASQTVRLAPSPIAFRNRAKIYRALGNDHLARLDEQQARDLERESRP